MPESDGKLENLPASTSAVVVPVRLDPARPAPPLVELLLPGNAQHHYRSSLNALPSSPPRSLGTARTEQSG